ncbi:MAG: type II toxin-antitoxin system RelE/ParE family toxin [bacterium]
MPALYRIEYASLAARQLRKLPRDIQEQLRADIEKLAEYPRPHGFEPYKKEPGTFRIRSGAYRIVYEIRDSILLVLVLKLGHRRDIYR